MNLDNKEELTEFFNNCNWLIRLRLSLWSKQQFSISNFTQIEDQTVYQAEMRSKIINCFLALPYNERVNLLNEWLLSVL